MAVQVKKITLNKPRKQISQTKFRLWWKLLWEEITSVTSAIE